MNGGQLLPQELVRAFTSYFRRKGGVVPVIQDEIHPVVIVDDNSAGPYPPNRSWHGGVQAAAVAVQFSYVAVMNNDPIGTHSCVVVDLAIIRPLVADDIMVGMSSSSALPLVGGRADDCANEAPLDPTVAFQPLISNVLIGIQQNGSALGFTQRIPHNDILPRNYPGPFTLGPQCYVAFRPVLVNEGIHGWFRGRYYPAL